MISFYSLETRLGIISEQWPILKNRSECVISKKAALKHCVVFNYKLKISWIIKFCNTKKEVPAHPTATIIVVFMSTIVRQ